MTVETTPHHGKFNYTVNGFRGLCIFLVFIFHIENSGIIPDLPSWGHYYEALRYFISSFKYGVEMFFMISGYVIIASLRRHDSAKKFLTDRAIRIFPTWVPLHLLSFIAGPIIGRGIFQTFDPVHWTITFFATLLFLPTILPFDLVHPAAWSLSYEWCFYLVSAFAVFGGSRLLGKRVALIAGIVLAAILINLYPRGLFFVPGILLAVYEDEFRKYIRFFRWPLLTLVVFLLAWLGTDVGPADINVLMTEWLFDGTIIYAAIAFISGTYMFACIILNTGWLSQVLKTRLMQFYGNISYAFYLWSPVAMMICKIIAVKLTPYIGAWPAVGFFTISSFIASTIVSWLNWRVIEVHLTSLIKAKLNKKVISAA